MSRMGNAWLMRVEFDKARKIVKQQRQWCNKYGGISVLCVWCVCVCVCVL